YHWMCFPFERFEEPYRKWIVGARGKFFYRHAAMASMRWYEGKLPHFSFFFLEQLIYLLAILLGIKLLESYTRRKFSRSKKKGILWPRELPKFLSAVKSRNFYKIIMTW